jgi:hypothetical protein
LIAAAVNRAIHTGGKRYGLLLRRGKRVGKAKENDLAKALLNRAEGLIKERQTKAQSR